MTILFWIHTQRANHSGEAPIILRIIYKKIRKNVRTGLYTLPNSWDSKKQKLRGASDLAKEINHHIQTHKLRVLRAYDELQKDNKPFDVESIVEKYSGKHTVSTGVLEAFKLHNDQVQAKIGLEFTIATWRKYTSCMFKLKKFIATQYKRDDVLLSEVTRKTISEFDFYLRTVYKNQHNTVLKSMQQFKKVIKHCRINDMISHDPFDSYTFKLKETHKEYLTMQELQKLIEYKPSTQRLEAVKDVFLFQCFSGLAHADVYKLSSINIKTGVDDKLWINIPRTKTNQLTQVPLLPVTETILKKYSQDANCIAKNKLLPVVQNQPMNRALKDLFKEVGISKILGTHSGRHTFATTVLLGNGIRIETVSKLLAHRNIKTTQIYAKITEVGISKELEGVQDDLSNKFKM